MDKPYTFIPTELAQAMKAQLSWLPELAAILQEEGIEVSEQELLHLALSFCVFVPIPASEQSVSEKQTARCRKEPRA